MKIAIDPMPAIRAAAEKKIDEYFSVAVSRHSQKDTEYAVKRIHALAVVTGGAASPEFVDAAAVEGLSALEFAHVILSKPDLQMQTAADRRRHILNVRAQTTPEGVQAVVDRLTKSPAIGG